MLDLSNLFNVTTISTLVILGFFGLLTFHYWNHKYYKTIKFQTYTSYLTAIATAFICFGIIFQVSTYFQQRIQDKITIYTNLNESFLQPIFDLFMQYPEMNYYYNDLFGIEKINSNVKRNQTLELQISMVIFSTIAVPAVYIELSSDKDMVSLSKKGLVKILKTFMKCKLFVYYYVTYFKPNIAGPVVVKFMEQNFNV